MRTTFLMIIGICFCLNASAKKIPANNLQIEKGMTILSSEQSFSSTLYTVQKEDGTIFYAVVAAIATNLIPDAAEAICMRTVGDSDVCNAVYDVSSALISMKGVKVHRGITNGLRWAANRGRYRSYAQVDADTYSKVSKIQTAFEAYKNLSSYGNGIPWSTISQGNAGDRIYSTPIREFAFYNFTRMNFPVQLSIDGLSWKTYTINSISIQSFECTNCSTNGFLRYYNGKTIETYRLGSESKYAVEMVGRFPKVFLYNGRSCD